MFETATWSYLHIYGWKDIVEIGLFSGIIHYFSTWLKKDSQKPLLLSFYSYCLLFVVCSVFHLTTITTVLLIFSPTILVIFILLHQENLQRNFIALHKIKPAQTESHDWVESLVRSCLITSSNNKSLKIIIERHTPLDSLVATSLALRCSLQDGLLDFLITSPSFLSEQMIWVQDTGMLVGLNSSWKKTSIEIWFAQEVKEQEPWLQEAIFFTTKVDALFIKTDPLTRTFTLVAQGKILEKASAHAAVKTIKNYLGKIDQTKKGDVYASNNTQSVPEQSLS
jgi:hypothetical protein